MTSITSRPLLLVLALALAACGSDGGGDGGPDAQDPGSQDGVCDDATRVGSIAATLGEGATSVQGKVFDGLRPELVPVVAATDGMCQLLRPPTLFCDPSCAAGTTCDATGTCVASANAISIGMITIDGLNAPVSMTASAPVFYYMNTAALGHPGFAEGATIRMNVAGEDPVAPFALGATGIAAIETAATSVTLDRDVPVALSWTPPASAGVSTVHIDLNITQHGGTPGRIECEVPDTGSFEMPVSLTNQLLDAGFSGFPGLSLTRRAADHADTAVGCVEFVLQSTMTYEVIIDGLTSCGDDFDCTPPETCQGDLTCG